ncbi:hypothetical protein EW146_g8805 [Bondarzewia mesenterica]|uniref:Protein kinase domain-containing protein n=1 Tax=Bondarzewia mesenterica TaxID=1095465 RepID=A0A4S4LBD2_9AGAM|nr:hypothetical protein EW146_g8805 [Bondarzewia mesenterica]
MEVRTSGIGLSRTARPHRLSSRYGRPSARYNSHRTLLSHPLATLSSLDFFASFASFALKYSLLMDCEERPSLFVFNEWIRDPKGPFLDKRKAPRGKRTPNSMIWGHTIDDLFYIKREASMNVVTIWSRSMIQELGENYLDEEHEYEPEPRMRRPWPLLKLKHRRRLRPKNDFGIVDNSDHDGSYERIIDPSEDEDDGPIIPSYFPLKLNASDKMKRSLEEQAGGDVDNLIDFKSLPPDKGEGKAPVSDKKGNVDDEESDRTEQEKGEGDFKSANPQMPPALEEFIPKEYFPDTLLVYDPDSAAISLSSHRLAGRARDLVATQWLTFKRVLPTFESSGQQNIPSILSFKATKRFVYFVCLADVQASSVNCSANNAGSSTEKTSEPRVAHLRISKASKLGEGHHSTVYLSALTLPRPLSARTPTGEVSVACKMAHALTREARRLLRNEGDIYNSFPKHLQEEWCGLNVLPPLRTPVPVAAVVPKFYGYYKPVYEEGKFVDQDEGMREEIRRCIEGLSPILLVEHCGQPIESECSTFTTDDKISCYSLLRRLHLNDYVHHSFYQRNLLVQPGPLTVPPAQRSLRNPSYRVIDFGRTERRDGLGSLDSNRWVDDAFRELLSSRGELSVDVECGPGFTW